MRDPIDNPENEIAERIITNAVLYSRSLIADAMVPLLWEISEEVIDEINIPLGWDDWLLDHKEQLIEAIYDELYADARLLWEE